MSLFVQKFGGTSVGDVDLIKNVAKRVKRTWNQGNQVVVVVSARAGVTNDLISRAAAITKSPDPREMDVLRGICEGKANKEIARDLDVQEVTIKLHVKTLSRKLQARNRTHAAMIARDKDLV